MKLLVDSGNTRLKWAWSEGNGLDCQPPITAGKALTRADLEKIWGRSKTRPEEVWIANVAGPAVAGLLLEWVRSHWAVPATLVTSYTQGYGVISPYAASGKLGVDRWLALVAVRHLYPLPVCIVDCGTALTVDVMAPGGEHKGGLICPGLGLMYHSLGNGTAEVNAEERGGDSSEVLGLDTVSAVRLGIYQAAAGLIERVVARMAGELPGLQLILTGGDACEIAMWLQTSPVVVPELVLQGLAEVSRRS